MLLAWSSPASSDVAEEYNIWQDEVHIPQIRQLLGSVSRVSRYVAEVADEAGGLPRHLTIYELDTSDVEQAQGILVAGQREGTLDRTTTMNTTDRPGRIEWYRVQP
ncbi:hypothetical protein [Rhodococcus koreensis]